MPCFYNYCSDRCSGVCYPGSKIQTNTSKFTSGDNSEFWKELILVRKESPTSFICSFNGYLYRGNSVAGYSKI